MTKSIIKATEISGGIEVFGAIKPTSESFEKYSQSEKNFLEGYIYMIESNLVNGAARAIDYNMTLNYFNKLSNNGVSLSPSFIKDYKDSEVGVYLMKLDAKVKKYAIEALSI